MRLRPLLAFGITIAALAITSESSAQLVCSERITALNINFLYGGGDGTYPGSDSLSNGSLTSGFASQLSGQQYHEGFTGDTTWAAGIQYQVDQEVAFSSNSIIGSGSTDLYSFLSGDGYADINGRNELELSFTNGAERAYTLTGAAGSGSLISLDRFNGSDWESVFTNLGTGGFSVQGTLIAGQFRIRGLGETAATGQQQGQTAWYYDFNVVPEPGTVLGFAGGATLLLARRRKIHG